MTEPLVRRDARGRRVVPAMGLGLLALLAPAVFPPAPRLLWNASTSAPVGLYAVSPGAPYRTGDMVVAWPPGFVRSFAADRFYLPRNVPLVKRVAAVAPATLCAAGPRLMLNGTSVYRLSRDGQGRLMPWWNGCRQLHPDEILLLMGDNPASFDGRYFGPSLRSDVIGPAKLLWRR